MIVFENIVLTKLLHVSGTSWQPGLWYEVPALDFDPPLDFLTAALCHPQGTPNLRNYLTLWGNASESVPDTTCADRGVWVLSDD